MSGVKVMIRKYPKPVLCGDLAGASLYKEIYSFELSLSDECTIKNDVVRLIFSAKLNSNYLHYLIKDKKAKPFYKIQTNRYSRLFECDINETIVHDLNKSFLDRIDKIQISLMVVADTNIDYSNGDELIDVAKDFSFFYKKGELMAISNIESLNYKLSGNPFINISLAETQEGKGLLFSSSGNEVIQIKVGRSLNDAYAKLQMKRDVKDILNPFLAFTAILYALEKAISDDEQSYKEKDWYKILDQSFDSDTYDSLDDFIESMRDNFDADIIFDVVQKMLNNSLELKVRDVARRIK